MKKIINSGEFNLDLVESGSVNGNGFMLVVEDEYGNQVVDAFLTKDQLKQAKDKIDQLLKSGWAD